MDQSTGSKTRTWARTHRGFLLVLVLFFGLALAYNAVTPIGESDNELSHYRYIQYVKAYRDLPRRDATLPAVDLQDQCLSPAATLDEWSRWQFRQPPLYYALSALTLFWVDSSDYWWPVPNQYAYHTGSVDGGVNAFIHTPDEAIVHNDVVQAVKLHRLFSTVVGLFGLGAVYLTGLLLFRRSGRTGAVFLTAAVAFVPSYIFSAATISNDIMVGVLGLWCIYFCLRSVMDAPDLRAFTLASFTFALAFLAKYTAIVLIPVFLLATVALIVRSWRRGARQMGRTSVALLVLALIQGLIISWWFIRNQREYNEAIVGYLGTNTPWIERLAQGVRLAGDNLVELWSQGIRFTFNTYWGLLGADAITLPRWQLLLLTALTLLALMGLLWQLLRGRLRRGHRWLILLGVAVLLVDWYLIFSLLFYGGRGRYMLSLFSIIGFLYVLGARGWGTPRLPWLGGYLYAGALLLISAAAPFLVLQPTYATPPLAATAELRAGESPVHAYVGDLAELVGMRVEPQNIAPFEAVDVTLVWRVLNPTTNNNVVGVHLIGVDQTYFGGISHLSANGAYPTSLWQPGDVLRDHYRFYTESGANLLLPTGARVKVSMVCPVGDDTRHQPITSAAGDALGDAVYSSTVRFGQAVAETPPPGDPLARFGEELALIEVSPLPAALDGVGRYEFAFRWQALQQPDRDYSVFVQLRDERNQLVLGADFPLTHGYYPSSLWQPGEIVEHRHPLDLSLVESLPSGAYRLVLGLYDLESGQRLPLAGAPPATATDGYTLGEWSLEHNITYLPWIFNPVAPAPVEEGEGS